MEVPDPAVISNRTRVRPSTASSARVTPSAFRATPLSASPSVAFPGWVTRKSSSSAAQRSSSARNEAKERSHSSALGLARLMRYESCEPATRSSRAARSSAKAPSASASKVGSAQRLGCFVKIWTFSEKMSRARPGAF